jgi:glycine/D-amino acid oxidase-like deaminating enzyme
MPCWSISPKNEFWYGFPLLREGYVKVANDRLGERVDPDVDRSLKPEFVDWAMDFLRYRIPVLGNGKVVGGRACLYTNSPDDNFIVDWAPGMQRILMAGGGSSHGFKFGAAIGPIIADALEEKPNPLGDQFRIGKRLNLGLKSRQKANIPGFAY